MKSIFFTIYFALFFQVFLQSQTLDATLLELKFSNDGYPEKFTKVDNGFFFSSEDDQLWFSDGTEDNTFLVKDFESGLYDDISSITPVGSKVFFVAENGNDNRELWMSDGTELGTIQLTDRNVGYSTEGIYNIIEYNGKIYFGAYSEVFGNELWVSDGTPEGTFVLKDIAENGNSSPRDFFVFNNKLIFKASTDEYNVEFWTSDGTEEGTVLLKDIREGNQAGAVSLGQVIFNGNFYFFANDGTTGTELWKSDGTPEGTRLLKDIHSGYSGSNNSMIGAVLNNKLLFVANDGVSGNELWETDGTLEGTSLFYDINNGVDSGFEYNGILNLVGDKIFFTGTDGALQSGLWVSDGTSQNTFFLNDASPNLLSGNSIGTFAIYFANDDLWKSDGTVNGTIILSEDIQVTNISVSDQSFLAYDNNIFFNGKNEVNGNELWVTDGTTDGTKLFHDVNHSYGVSPSLLTAVGNQLFFRGNQYGFFTLCTSDGTIEGTQYLNGGENGLYIRDNTQFLEFNGKLIFSGSSDNKGFELWTSDGTEAGTFMIKDVFEGKNNSMSDYQKFTVIQDKIYFSADDGVHGFEPWVSDGTAEGTYMLKDLYVGPNDGHGSGFVHVNESTFFTGLVSGNQRGFWKTDGTNEGTVEIDFLSEAGIYGSINDKMLLYLLGDLYVSDGTESGTTFLSALEDGTKFRVSGEDAYYYVTGYNDNKLYKTDGVSSTQIFETDPNNDIRELTMCEDYLYFAIREGFSAIDQLWRTDGTTTGTVMIAESNTENLSYFRNLTCFDENLLYLAESSAKKIWLTNGQPNQAIQLDVKVSNGLDFQGNDNIGYMEVGDGKLYFEARNDISGSEIYVVTPDFSPLSVNNIDEIQANNSKTLISIYPNPANQFINIKSIKKTQIQSFELFNMLGKRINKQENKILSSEMTYSTSKLLNGIYLIKVQFFNGNIASAKLIIN